MNDPQDRTMPSGPATENRAQAAETQKVMLAEAACANMLSRLHDTLDFQTLFDEMWARDPVFKERFRRNNFEQFKTRVSYDPQLTEHVIASTFSTLYLLFQYDTEHPDRPKELQRLLDKLDRSQTRCRSAEPSSAALLRELKRSIKAANSAAEWLRGHLSRDHFSSAKYIESVEGDAASGKRHGFPQVRRGEPKLGIGEDTLVYQIYREGFRWYFIEENGQFRLVGFDVPLMSLGYL